MHIAEFVTGVRIIVTCHIQDVYLCWFAFSADAIFATSRMLNWLHCLDLNHCSEIYLNLLTTVFMCSSYEEHKMNS
jgi:hypothetical protein